MADTMRIPKIDTDFRKKVRKFLEGYHSIVWTLNALPQEITNEYGQECHDLKQVMDYLDIELSRNNSRITNRLISCKKTYDLFTILESALDAVKRYPEGGKVMYEIIYYSYLAEEKYSLNDVINKIEISRTSFFRLKQIAIDLVCYYLQSYKKIIMETCAEIENLFQ